jgi:hypothetical protein
MIKHPSGKPKRANRLGIQSRYRVPWKGYLTPRLQPTEPKPITADALGFQTQQPTEEWTGAWAIGFVPVKQAGG